jgi:3-oxoacyl-[acyl-carrier-protein] synthase-1
LERLHAALAHVPLAPDCEIRAGDHAGVFAAVADGVRRLQSGAATACLIGGVDSLLSTERLADLDARDRLKTRYNPHGIVPGEAAVFLVVELEAEARRRKAAVWARLSRVGLGREPRPIGSDEPCLAEGLTEAILKATPESVQPRPLLGVVCDLNGEPYRAGEWGLARPRATAWAREVLLSHPADCLGDVGAAAGALLVGLASIAIHERYAVSPELLVWAGSDDGSRAAVFVGAASEAK